MQACVCISLCFICKIRALIHRIEKKKLHPLTAEPEKKFANREVGAVFPSGTMMYFHLCVFICVCSCVCLRVCMRVSVCVHQAQNALTSA